MKSLVNSDMLPDEVFVGNTQLDYVELHLSSLKTYRLGNVAYDINNCRLNDGYKPCYVHKSEIDLYNQCMQKKHDIDYQNAIMFAIECAFRPVTEDYPKFGIEGVGFSPDWIDEDCNINGTRWCFRDYSGWHCTKWNMSQDCYSSLAEWSEDLDSKPTHFMIVPRTKLIKL